MTTKTEGRRPDGMTHREHSLATLNLALQLADDLARCEVESFAQIESWPLNGPAVYRLDKSCHEVDGAEVRATSSEEVAKDIADAQRAARYVDLRMPHLPYTMHRDPTNPNRVWFTDKE